MEVTYYVKRAFTLAEILITLGIIGIVAAMTIPSLIAKNQEKAIVTALQKFNSILSQAILLYKNETGNITFGSGNDSDPYAFDPIAKYMKFTDKCTTRNILPNCRTVSWLPEYNQNYYGEKATERTYAVVAQNTYDSVCYMLSDGMSFCIDVDPSAFSITVDVNGKKTPNRIGQDIFYFTVGLNDKDLQPGYLHSDPAANGGLCILPRKCNPNNTDPEKDGGAFPTAYVLLNHKLPPKYSK